MSKDHGEQDLDRLLQAAAPHTREYPPPAHVRENILTPTPRRARRQRGRVWRPVRLALPAICVLAFVAVLFLTGNRTSVPVSNASAASIVLNRAADATERLTGIPPGRFLYERSIESLGDGPFTSQTWTAANGKIVRAIATHHGRTTAVAATAAAGQAAPIAGLTVARALALTTDPRAILHTVRAALDRPQPVMDVQSDRHGAPPVHMTRVPYTAREVFGAVMDLYDSRLPLSSKQRAGLLRAAALLPGVRFLGRITDPLERAADAIAIAGDHAHEGYGRAYLLSPTTGQLISTLELRHGHVSGWSITQRAITTTPRQQPLPTPRHLPAVNYPLPRSSARRLQP